MKLYNSVGPNPKAVRMFAAELGTELELEKVDLRGGANRQEPFLSKNPAGQLPCLELDDGTTIAEITAICEYLDDAAGHGSGLIGTTAEQRAETRMWTRRIDLGICEPMAAGFRYSEGLQLFQNRMRCLPEAADGLKACAQDKLKWLDGQLAGKDFICGDRFSMADVVLFAFLEFGANVGQPLDPELKNVGAWFERVKARPSATA